MWAKAFTLMLRVPQHDSPSLFYKRLVVKEANLIFRIPMVKTPTTGCKRTKPFCNTKELCVIL